MLATNRAIQYYRFVKWFKASHHDLYIRYAIFINVPNEDMRISVSIDYVSPEDKIAMLRLIKFYNDNNLD